MKILSDKVMGCIMSIAGAGGIIAGIGVIIDEPKKMIGYFGAISSAVCLNIGIKYFRKAYSNNKGE